jgi:Gnt-I system high-affinity gluconate transporter
MFLVGAFKADLGKTLMYGLVISIPVVIIAGPFLGRFLKRLNIEIPAEVKIETEKIKLPGVFVSFLLALLPVVLIALSVVAATFFPGDSLVNKVIYFIGDATVALLISVLLAVLILGIARGRSMQQVMQWLNDAVVGVAVILLIITAGGVFKQVLIDSGTADYITSFSKQWSIHPLLFAWIVTALLRVAIGSATVAGITAAGIVSPLLATGTVSPELLVLAVGTGSVFGSHVNDSGFWIFKEFFQISLKQTFLSWTVMETLISILGLVGVMVLSMVIK